ncbi:hypothetical protein PL373_18865 [Tenacibaculum maritimum]|nr:hypothetical protein [Tenacibaculum maritimum]MDB0603150.1 hypothetical protein [Tenacibaculum maritimum]MDB0610414.1 hypothetical protein [Tenacibaculum maritimum]
MNKRTNKNQKFNSVVINRLIEKYGFTGYYIRQCLKDQRNNETADTIRKDYKRLVKQVENALNQ